MIRVVILCVSRIGHLNFHSLTDINLRILPSFIFSILLHNFQYSFLLFDYIFIFKNLFTFSLFTLLFLIFFQNFTIFLSSQFIIIYYLSLWRNLSRMNLFIFTFILLDHFAYWFIIWFILFCILIFETKRISIYYGNFFFQFIVNISYILLYFFTNFFGYIFQYVLFDWLSILFLFLFIIMKIVAFSCRFFFLVFLISLIFLISLVLHFNSLIR